MKNRKILKIIAVFSGLLGLGVLVFVVYPIATYKPPIGERKLEVSENDVDYTNARNWFPGASNDFVSENITYYTISIPKLRIENATVAIGGEDLSESLIQYPGTAVPGKRGNAVIFGHSILPQFYNPQEYLSIFSLLPSIEKGDEVEVVYDGVVYKYRVEDMLEVSPTDIQVLEQNLSDSFLTLVTCVPPGDPRRPRRLVVKARIVPLGAYNTDYEDFGN